MVFVKGMEPTKGFTGKKHTEYSKFMMSETRKEGYRKKRLEKINVDNYEKNI